VQARESNETLPLIVEQMVERKVDTELAVAYGSSMAA
jgi:hypothetical protein